MKLIFRQYAITELIDAETGEVYLSEKTILDEKRLVEEEPSFIFIDEDIPF